MFSWALRTILILIALFQGLSGLRAWIVVSTSRLLEESPIQWLEPLFFRSALESYLGKPLYDKPTLEYVGAMYTPLVDVVNGAVISVAGVSYSPFRFASFIAFLGIIVLIGLFVYRETSRPLWALVVASTIPTLDSPLNHWFSSLNVDAWYLLFVFAAMFVVRFYPRAFWAAGLLATIATGFKQQALIPALALALYLILVDSRQGLRFILAYALSFAVLAIYYLISSGGWFWVYTFALPLSVPAKENFQYLEGLLRLSPIATLLFFALWPAASFRQGQNKTSGPFWAFTGAAFLAFSFFSFRKVGGGENSLAPVLLFGLLLFGVLMPPRGHGKNFLAAEISWLVTAVLILHLGFASDRDLASRLWPSGHDLRPWSALNSAPALFERRIKEALQAKGAPAFVGARILLPFDEAGPLNTHQTPLYNLTTRARLVDIEDIAGDSIRAKQYKVIVLWEYPDDPFQALVQQYYNKSQDLGIDPLIGLKVSVWLPK